MKNKIRTIIIEDDINAQEYLASILNESFSDIEIVAFINTVEGAIHLIRDKKPELVFMDIELKDGIAFNIFNKINIPNFEVIFVTGHENYIKKAIEHYAFSYIMKPIDSEKLIKVVNRYINLKQRLFSISKYEMLSDFLNQKNSNLLLHVGSEYILIDIKDVVKCIAEKNYTSFYMQNKVVYLASKPLKYYQELFSVKGFFRANRSVLINIDFIKSIYRKETIILKNRDKINVSVRNRSNLTNLINSLS
ncbi:LytR/AlgR family response regulator transcription factor [Flavivirga jejuensis]|uniref:LytTR family DNA-binding domain-containing protein n=1 Tax=Flavivirga jejuensis TaxID=870487 RepID=A0ABT8WK53_9FLAO|nr:LytTR family DNA-binding domain-containing protein [Flavivirga jejuensis]MDO5973493.1 LytTR family DNA-binding domain-containing protein [Flavivirga jejuensis]